MSDSFVTPWIVALQALLCMGFSRQEYWSGLPFLPQGGLPDPGTEPMAPVSPVMAGRHFTIEPHFSQLSRSMKDSLIAQLVKNPLAMWETWVQSLGWDDPLEKGSATHSSILAWRISWTV